MNKLCPDTWNNCRKMTLKTDQLILSELALLFYEIALENIEGEEENAGNQYFLLSPKYFLSY